MCISLLHFAIQTTVQLLKDDNFQLCQVCARVKGHIDSQNLCDVSCFINISKVYIKRHTRICLHHCINDSRFLHSIGVVFEFYFASSSSIAIGVINQQTHQKTGTQNQRSPGHLHIPSSKVNGILGSLIVKETNDTGFFICYSTFWVNA